MCLQCFQQVMAEIIYMISDKSYIYFQVSSFSSRGLETGYITSTSDAAMIEKVVNGKCQLVYFPPEALLENRKWRSKVMNTPHG